MPPHSVDEFVPRHRASCAHGERDEYIHRARLQVNDSVGSHDVATRAVDHAIAHPKFMGFCQEMPPLHFEVRA